MHNLPQLETARAPHRAGMAVIAKQGPTWHLALDEIVDTGEAARRRHQPTQPEAAVAHQQARR